MKLRSAGIEVSIRLKTSLPGPKSIELLKRRQKEVARGPFHVTPIFLARAKGALLEDVDGNQLIDFAAGIGVVNAGHCEDSVVRAIRDQAGEFLHAGFNVTPYEKYIELAERLNRATPGDFAKKSFLANSGAEAVENAIKIARAHTGREAVICFEHAFHGRTYMAMTLTSKEKPYKVGFGPYNSEVYRTPFPYVYRWPGGGDARKVSEECFQQFEALAASKKPAAVILEPVLGEGGFVVAPAEFLARLRDFCTTQGIVLIADEIQTGFGRTGTLFACEQLGLVPDVILSAKGLGAGMPISAVTGRAEIMDAPVEGGIGGTFGGSPVSCAAALAGFDLFEKGDLLARAQALGEALSARLDAWKSRFEIVGDSRGLGPMRAIELVRTKASREPNPEACKSLVRYAYERGVVVMSSGTHSNVLRFLMPLTIEPAELNEGLAVIEAGLGELK